MGEAFHRWVHRKGVARTIQTRWGSSGRPLSADVITALPLPTLARYAAGREFPRVASKERTRLLQWTWRLLPNPGEA